MDDTQRGGRPGLQSFLVDRLITYFTQAVGAGFESGKRMLDLRQLALHLGPDRHAALPVEYLGGVVGRVVGGPETIGIVGEPGFFATALDLAAQRIAHLFEASLEPGEVALVL